jgi:hypothetical protein
VDCWVVSTKYSSINCELLYCTGSVREREKREVATRDDFMFVPGRVHKSFSSLQFTVLEFSSTVSGGLLCEVVLGSTW